MKQELHEEKRLVGKGEIAAYSLAGGGQNFCYALVTGYLMYYYINVFGIHPQIVSIMLLLEGIWDIVNNPLAGFLIDRTRTKWGKMVPYLRTLSLPLAACTVLLFSGPLLLREASPTAPLKVIFMFVSYFLWELCYTITDVSYWGLSAAISPHPGDRRRVMTSMNVAINVCSAFPYLLVPFLMDYAASPGSRLSMSNVFFLFGMIGGVVGIGLFSLAGFFVKERVEQSSNRPGLRESAAELLHNSALRSIVLSGLILSLSGIGYAFMNYYFIDVLGSASLSVLSQIPAAITWLFSYALLPVIKKRFNNRQFMLLCQCGFGAIWLFIYLIGIKYYTRPIVVVPASMVGQFLFGLISSPCNIILNEMMAEATDYSEWRTGKRNEGVGFSMKITTQKIGNTVIQSISACLLSAIGYVTQEGNARVQQTEVVQRRIFTIYTLIPAVVYLLSAIPFFTYDLVGEKRETMLRELKQRRAGRIEQPEEEDQGCFRDGEYEK